MRKAAAVKATVPALSAPHKPGGCLAAARTMRRHRLILIRRNRAQHCGPSRPVRCRPCVRLGCWIRCAKGFVTCTSAEPGCGVGRGRGPATRWRRVAPRAGTQVPACWVELALVLGVPARPSLDRSAQRGRAPTSPVRPDLPASVQARRYERRHRQARHTSHAAPLLRNALAARRVRHPHRAGPAGVRRRGNHHDLHPRAQARRGRGAQPA